MKLKLKIFYLLFILVLSYIAFRCLVQALIIDPEFNRLENSLAIKDLARTNNLIQNELQNILVTAKDWSVWNGTYEFLKHRNQSYIDNNLMKNVLSDIKMDIFFIYDINHKLYWSDIVENKANSSLSKNEQIKNIDNLLQTKFNYLFLNSSSKKNNAVTGVIESRYGPILLAVTPILGTENGLPCLGSMIMGRFLSNSCVASMSNTIEIPFDVFPLLYDKTPMLNAIIAGIKNSDNDVFIDKKTNKGSLYLYSYLNVLKGSAPILLKVSVPREVFLRTNRALNYSMLSLIIATIIIAVILWFFLHEIITKPLIRLTNFITKISKSDDFSSNITSSKKDEIGQLTKEFDTMISNIRQARSNLMQNLAEKEKLISDLNDASAKIKTLKTLLPICASCKKIRDDNGYWNQVETYIKVHTDTKFSHSMCPECAKKLYPDLDIEKLTQSDITKFS